MKKKIMKVNVMGSEYTVYMDNKESDEILKKCDGYILPELKQIILDENEGPAHTERVLTHEMVHAFLYESGLDVETWANNEEIVDWMAIQLPKMSSAVAKALKEMKPVLKRGKVIFDDRAQRNDPDGA